MPDIHEPTRFNDMRYGSKYPWLVRVNVAKAPL
jgi:hypothetical protein